MKKYKLIKEYPGSPKLGTIITPTNGYRMTYLDAHKYPEFWEEIVEKDYKILSFKSESKCEQYRILDTDTGLYKYFKPGNHELLSKEYLIQEGSYQIHSIKRLSDGEVFTIGDKINSTISDLSRFTDLTGFKLDNNKISLGLKIGLGSLGYYPLNTIIKYKKPLFTTEDGVDIYDPLQKVFSVSECDFKLQDHQDYSWVITRDSKRKYHHFSTKEAAKEYILMNKPKYSLNDIIISIPKNKDNLKVVKQIIENLKNM